MELLLKNVSEEHLALLDELAKTLHFEVTQAVEDDAWYLQMMAEAKNDPTLSKNENREFINSLS